MTSTTMQYAVQYSTFWRDGGTKNQLDTLYERYARGEKKATNNF